MVEHNLAKVGVASSNLVSRSRFHLVEYFGWMAEWLCSGLQIRVPRFDSGSSLHNTRSRIAPAQVAKLVDARDLKSLGRNTVPVRFRPRAPSTNNHLQAFHQHTRKADRTIIGAFPKEVSMVPRHAAVKKT